MLPKNQMFNNYSMLLRSSCRSSVVCCNKVAASALTPMLVPDSRNITTNNRNIIDIKNTNNNNNNSIVKQNYFDITDDFLRIQAQKLLRDKNELIKFGEPRRNKLFGSFATSSSSYLKSLIAKFPFTASNTSSSFFFSPQYRHSFHSRPARTFFIETTTSTLFTSQRFCSTSTSPPPQQEQQEQLTNDQPAATKNSKDVISEELFFNDEVVKHVVAEVSKNKILKDVFQEIDRALSGSNENNKIERNHLASRYAKIYEELNSAAQFTSDVARKVDDWLILAPVKVALKKYVEIASRKSAVIAEQDYSLLFGTIYLLCCFASSPRLDARNINGDNVDTLRPCIHFTHLSNIVESALWPKAEKAQQPLLVQLLVSTLQKVQNVEAEKYKQLPQVVYLIETAHNNLRKSNEQSIQEQCDFTKEANAYFACSDAGRQTCQKRFVSPKAGPGITNCFRSQWDPEDVCPLGNQFRPDILNIVAGSSGSGKTISSLISSASAGIPVYNILLHATTDCIKQESVACKNDRDDQALKRLLKGILLALESSKSRGDATREATPLPTVDDEDWKSDSGSPRTCFAGAPKYCNLILRIVVDEIGSDPEFLRALCSVWPTWRVKIAKWLGVWLDQLQLVAVGTGLDNFELAQHGSIADSYKVLMVIRSEVIFKKLFYQQLTLMNGETQRPPAEDLFEMLFGEKADPNALHPSFPRSEDPVFSALRRLATNPRCAAIILSLMHQAFVTNLRNHTGQNMDANVAPVWSLVQLRATVSYWCVAAVAIFSSKSSLANMSAEQRHYALGKAIAYSLNRSLRMDGDNAVARAEERKRYVVKYGLLSDTARVIPSDYNAPATGSSPANVKKSNDAKQQSKAKPTMLKIFQLVTSSETILTFGIPDDEVRFHVDDAFVMMYLIMSETVSNGVFAKSYSNVDLLFEEAVFDFQRLAAQFGHRHPVFGSFSQVPSRASTADGAGSQNTNSSAASSGFEAKIVLLRDALIEPCHIPVAPDAAGFTPPHLLYGLGCDTVHSATLSSRLEESALENAVIPPAIQLAARIWRDKVHRGHAVALLNGASATMADTIILAKNRIILTQCKHGEKIDSATIHEEIFKLRRKKLLSLLCWCVATSPTDTKVEVFYVVAGGDKKNINTDYPNKTSCSALDSTIKIDGTTITFHETKIHQVYQLHESIHFTYAFDGDSKKALPYSPILRSKLPSAETVCDRYTTMKHVVQFTSNGEITKSSCPASEMLPTKLTKN